MRILNTARGWGKTEFLVKWTMEDPERVLAVKNNHMRRYVLDHFYINPNQVIAISSVSHTNGMGSLRGRRKSPSPIQIAVDESEELIQDLLNRFFQGNEVDIVSMSTYDPGVTIDRDRAITVARDERVRERIFNDLAQTYGMLTTAQAKFVLQTDDLDKLIADRMIIKFVHGSVDYYPEVMFEPGFGTETRKPSNVFSMLLKAFKSGDSPKDDMEIFQFVLENPVKYFYSDTTEYVRKALAFVTKPRVSPVSMDHFTAI